MSMTEAGGGGVDHRAGTTRSTTPGHRTSHACGIEVITVTRHMPFDIGNAIKYVVRAEMKEGWRICASRKSSDRLHQPPPKFSAPVRQASGCAHSPRLEPDPIKAILPRRNGRPLS